MVQIYLLIDPRNYSPFYVGASMQPVRQIKIRHMHKSDYKPFKSKQGNESFYQKNLLLYELYLLKMEPIVLVLELCNKEEATKREKFFYDRLMELGYTMLNDKSRFNYYANLKREYKEYEKR